ncbi:hypothetical protein SCHPADRAFT_832040 [Schizopora paradoxa]|uniref:Uncharacterized protein n=1 Tax=Schizopora paradoxa TaxID=27342 RepID=A0A0H2RG25_9AGAM|nr:hypothetical protein SCHPADRAFT_832040 [Schizopora paradoxa]
MRSVFAVLALAALAAAQRVSIAVPTAGQSIIAGNGAEVVIQKPDSLTSSTEIGVAVLIHHCTQSPCEDTTETLGQVFYAGPFNPQRPSGGSPGTASGAPFQSFYASVPYDFPKGPAVLNVAHASLVGAGPFFFNEIVNVTINIE